MNRVLILAILVLNKGRVWRFSLALGVSLLTQTVSSHKRGSECLVRSQIGCGFGKRGTHPLPNVLVVPPGLIFGHKLVFN